MLVTRREDRGCAPITLLYGAAPQTPERATEESDVGGGRLRGQRCAALNPNATP
jgi:hypothetical protein